MGMLLRRRNTPIENMTTKDSLSGEKKPVEKSTKDAKPPVVKRTRKAK